MNIFSQNDYREALRHIVQSNKKIDPKFGFHLLAKAARIQRPYLSKVMKGDAHLSSDQIYLIAQYLELSLEEQEFMQVLLDFERTAVQERKRTLKLIIERKNDEEKQSDSHLSAKKVESDQVGDRLAEYYLDPLNQIVHVALSIEQYTNNPQALAEELRVGQKKMQDILDSLQGMGLIEWKGSKLVAKESNIHLPADSYLYHAWRSQLKLLSMNRLSQLDQKEAYSFSTVFSADEKTRAVIHQHFLNFLKNCEELVQDAPTENVFQLSFDLFPWTSEVKRGFLRKRRILS